MTIKNIFLLVFGVSFIFSKTVIAQQAMSNEKVARLISVFKNDTRGTYKSIRWFCDDGTVRQPKDPCPDSIGGGIQHATYKDEVIALGKTNHLYFGQILAYTQKEDLWDLSHNHSRLKQYQLGRYLNRIDNGWVNQKGQFYRGAVQIEDEQNWGVKFYKWILANDEWVKKDFFLILQSMKDVPHKADDNVAQLMRSQSKVLSDLYPGFMDLRVKIHNNPEPEDIQQVILFKQNQSAKLTPDISRKMDELLETMKKFHKPVDLKVIGKQVESLTVSTPLALTLKAYVQDQSNDPTPAALSKATGRVLLQIRTQILNERNPGQRLRIMDIANQLEGILFKEANLWQPVTVKQQLDKIFVLSMAAAGTGAIELWEWDQVKAVLQPGDSGSLKLAELTQKLEAARGLLEWSTGMVKAVYQEEVNTYNGFEPLTYGFIDDRIRSTVSFQLGKSIGDLGAFIGKESALTNKVMGLKNSSTFRGLNPGYAFGELVVVSGSPEAVKISGDKIYIFDRAPSDLKPVAGIATVAEGNLVSHVQLLARNLGIPNAALSDENLQDLKTFSGKKVFYAVSNKGNVIIKPESEMTLAEKALFAQKTRKEEKIEVPVQAIRLEQKNILNLREVDAKDSGKLCGPKAANLGQLKAMFPDKVVEGFVIPFGIFRDHMDQPMPGENQTYWQFLNDMFSQADAKRNLGVSEEQVETYQLSQLEILRAAIKKMPLKAAFLSEINHSFLSVFGKPIGGVPVFLRSDTNMEDLKDFTGAGLNLTIFNAVDREKIIQGIKDVWASPYTERSFKWRQKYLLNPENVFPSILVIPSVDVDYSGVMITKGIVSGDDNDITIAFSRGAGGAVDGQAAESYLVRSLSNYQLISPAREPHYNSLPSKGGTLKNTATFEKPILSGQNINALWTFAMTIRKTFADQANSTYKGAYDVELGFKEDKLWLFQIRPFVENKKALASDYLESITPKIDQEKVIQLSEKI